MVRMMVHSWGRDRGRMQPSVLLEKTFNSTKPADIVRNSPTQPIAVYVSEFDQETHSDPQSQACRSETQWQLGPPQRPTGSRPPPDLRAPVRWSPGGESEDF